MSTTKSTPPSEEWVTTPYICKLPLELVSYIIVLRLREITRIDQRLKDLYSTRMVSRAWRNVVDSTPSLWNVVSDWVPLHVNSTSIERSGSYPLDVYITNDTFQPRLAKKHTPIELLALASKEVRRWSKVSLWLPSSDACSTYLTSPAPLLRDLHVKSSNWDIVTTPVTLFGGIAPRLEVLQVDRVPIDWNSSFVHGLRELYLSDMFDEQISAQQVLDILASAPLLQAISICNSSLDHHPQPFQIRTPVIHLPNIDSIEFDDIEIKTTEVIISSIRAPNCRSLMIIGSDDDEMDPSGFLEWLGHFNDFLRRTLSANGKSSMHISDEGMRWESSQSPASLSSLEFIMDLRCGAPATGVGWATGIVGVGFQEVEHNLEVCLAHDGFDEGDLAAYRSFSSCRSVTKLILDEDHTHTGQILELLGTWQEPEDGRDPLPGFPSLRILVLTTSSGCRWTLDDLELSVSRRFSEWDDRTIPPGPKLSIIIQASWWDYYGPGSAPDLAQLQRLRAAKGVEKLTRYMNKNKSGMLAVVYEDDTEL
ncbi:hypothetical protein FS837_010303 [Tulasnella sp. UAMH 9824]|nr:hypothetical protein FS837_010303 [Tulasnella sp. UAMH 9824]